MKTAIPNISWRDCVHHLVTIAKSNKVDIHRRENYNNEIKTARDITRLTAWKKTKKCWRPRLDKRNKRRHTC